MKVSGFVSLLHCLVLSTLLVSCVVQSEEEGGLQFDTQCDADDPTCDENGFRYGIPSNTETIKQKQKRLKQQSEQQRKQMGKRIFENVDVETHIMWVTPVEIYNVSVMEDDNDHNLEPYESNIELSSYLFNEYSQFKSKLEQKLIRLNFSNNANNMRRTTNEKWYHYQEYLFDEGRLYSSDDDDEKTDQTKNTKNKKNKKLKKKKSDSSITPTLTLDRLKARMWELVHIYFNRYGIMNSVAYLSQSTPMFLWSSVLEFKQGDYQPPISHESSVLTVMYFVESSDNRNTLVINDPRGSGIPPFGHKHFVPLVTGQLIIFPSYLSYYIEPVSPMDNDGESDDRTVILTFLVKGDWSDMSDVSFRDRLTGVDQLFSKKTSSKTQKSDTSSHTETSVNAPKQ